MARRKMGARAKAIRKQPKAVRRSVARAVFAKLGGMRKGAKRTRATAFAHNVMRGAGKRR